MYRSFDPYPDRQLAFATRTVRPVPMNMVKPIVESRLDNTLAQRHAGGDHGAALLARERQVPIYVNGRFAAQRISGVQRFSLEMLAALRNIYGERLHVLVPPDAREKIPGAVRVGRLSGQAWEQFEMPRHVADGFLVNLGNTAPLRVLRQLVVIHDAGVFMAAAAYNWRFRLWYRLLQRALARRNVQIVTVSNSARADISRHLPVAPRQIAVISEGSDHMDRLHADTRIIDALGLAGQGFVLAVGNLMAHKNLQALGPLAYMLARRGSKLVVTGALGGTAFSGRPPVLTYPACYAGRVTDEELKALYQAASCYVLPSRYEGFGLPAVEAMRCGCPVVAADIPALHDSCGAAALFCNPDVPDDFASRVALIIDDEGVRTSLRAAGIAHTREMSWTNAARDLSLIIATALEATWPA